MVVFENKRVVFENKRNGERASAGSSDMAQPEPPPSNYTGQTYRLAALRKGAGAVALFAGKAEQLERFLEVIAEHWLSQ